MQANKDQDWTDDAAFWDDAWADMNTRLDAEPNRRKGAIGWWPLYLCVAAGLAFAFLFFMQTAPNQNDPLAPSIPTSVETLNSADVIAKNEKGIADTPIAARSITRAQASSTPATDLREQPQTRQTTATVVGPVTTRTSPTRPSSLANNAPTTNDISATSVAAPSPQDVALSSNAAAPALPTTNDTAEQEVIADKLPISVQVASLSIAPLLTGVEMLQPNLLTAQRHQYVNPLTLEAGLINDHKLEAPGFFAGVGYRINNGKKLSFPLTLRYRLDQLKVRATPLGASDEASIPVGTGAVFFDQVLSPQSISSASLELGAGLALQVAPRLRVSTGFSATYLLNALLNFEGQSTTNINNEAVRSSQELYSLDLDRGEDLLSSLSESDSGSDISRLALRAKFGAAYDITTRLGLKLQATRLLVQPDRTGNIGFRTGQMEVGLSYRLR